MLDQNSQIDAHVYHGIINDPDDKGGEESVGTPTGNSDLIECFVKKFEEYINRDIDIYLKSRNAVIPARQTDSLPHAGFARGDAV